MKRLSRVLIPTTLLVLLLAPTALAGSVAVVTFAELPSDFDAGTPYTLDGEEYVIIKSSDVLAKLG